MFDKFLNDFELNMKTADNGMSITEQLKGLVEGKMDYVRIGDEKTRISQQDAKIALRYGNGDWKSVGKLKEDIHNIRKKISEKAAAKKRELKESESAMFDLVANFKYLPGIEKVLKVNGTVDGMEATCVSTQGIKYHIRISQIGAVTEDLDVIQGGESDTISAMRRAAINLLRGGVDKERIVLELQTIGLNKGLPIKDAVELAKKLYRQEADALRRR